MKEQILYKWRIVACAGLVACATLSLAAQTVGKTKLGVVVTPESGKYATEVMVYSPSIVRVMKYDGALDAMPEKHSFSVTMTPEKPAFTYAEEVGAVVLTTKNIAVSVDKRNGAVRFTSGKGEALLAEQDIANSSTDTWSQSFVLDKDEAIFGLGQRKSPKMNQRGESVVFWNSNTNITIPYFTSEKGYGLYWDNAGRSTFTDEEALTTFSSETGVGVDYYFMYADGSQDGVVAAIRQLTGDATMFPLWTMGFWQCRERYKSSDELCGVLDKYRSLRVPLDGIVQDWQYWGCDSNWNAMRFMNPHYINKMGDAEWMRYLPYDEDRNARYPEPRIKSPQEMVDYVHKNNAHLMISIWANFGPWTEQYKTLDKMGALYPFDTWPRNRGVKVYDAFNPKARDIYWNNLKNLYDMGFDAWWTDSTEPDHFDETQSDRYHETYAGTWKSVKNAFPLVTNGGIYEHQRKLKGGKRSFQMTRSGTFGMQRYATFSWSGDVVSNWETFRNQIPSGLNYVICGIPYWNTDIGGFFCWDDKNNPKSPHAQELQVRWLQWGCFTPLMRNHCSSPMVNEIYAYGEPGEWAFDVQKKFIELRYRMLPYIYSAMGDVVLNRGTMMRPFVMDFANDKVAINVTDEYMFGRSILVSPVTKPLYTYRDRKNNGHAIYPDVTKAAAPVHVYLPTGCDWFDFWTNEKEKGGRVIMRPAPIDIMPIYVKAGSIVPFGPAVQYAEEKPWDNLEVRVYPGADADFTLYEDEGDNYNYEKGQYTLIRFHWDDANRQLTIAQREGKYKGMIQKRSFRLLLVGGDSESGDKEPSAFTKTVEYDGKEIRVEL